MDGDVTLTETITCNEVETTANTENNNTHLLRLVPEKNVSWTEDTVDNEHLNKKSSKSCCIFHKKKNPDESSDSEDETCNGKT